MSPKIDLHSLIEIDPEVAIPRDGETVVYFVKIGKHIKIGVTRKLRRRLSAFLNSAPNVRLMLTIPDLYGGLEREMHELFAHLRIVREMFQDDGTISEFISVVKFAGLATACNGVRKPASQDEVLRRRAVDRQARLAAAKERKMEKDAYFASLVADRRKRLGW